MSCVIRRLVDFGTFTFDLSEDTLRREEELVDLPSRTASILKYLIENRERVISKEELKEKIWPNLYIELNSIDQHISRIRDALGDSPKTPIFIKTKYKRGWQFVAPAIERTVSAASVETPTGSEPTAAMLEAPAEAIPIAKGRWSRGSLILLSMLLITIGAAVAFWPFHKREARILESIQLTNDGKPKGGPLLSDGRRVFFMENFEGTGGVVSIPAYGGEATRLSIPLSHYALEDISRDGSKLLLQSSGPEGNRLWTFSIRSSLLQPVAAGYLQAAWSPDGQELAALGPNATSIHVLGGPLMSKSELSGRVLDLCWAPDGKRLRFSVADPRQESSTSWEITDKNRRPQQVMSISDGQKFVRSGIWSGDGKYFFYEAGTDAHEDIWGVKEGGWSLSFSAAKPFRLTTGEPGSWRWPAPSRDGSTILAVNRAIRSELVHFDEDTRSWKPEWDGLPAYELDYSRDRQWVTYTYLPDHTIWKARPDGTGRVRLSPTGVEAHQPHWSPNGTRIAFMGQNAKGQWRIFQVATGGGPMEESVPDGEDQGVPTWSSDGHFIIFGERLSAKPREEMSIHLIDLKSRRISDVAGTKGLWSPRWSPDGQYISAVTSDFRALRVLHWPGTEWKELTRMKMVDYTTWSSDSRYVYFSGLDETHHWWLCRLQMPDGTLERLIDLADFTTGSESYVGVTPEGVPLAFRGVTMQEIYALKCSLP